MQGADLQEWLTGQFLTSRETAELCLQKAAYAARQLTAHGRFSLAFAKPTFKEFVIRDAEDDVDGLVEKARQAGFLAGVPLGRWYPALGDCVAVLPGKSRKSLPAGKLSGTVRKIPSFAVRSTELR